MKQNLLANTTRVLWAAVLTLLAGACYDEFDPATYQPVFTIEGFSSSEEIQSESLVAYWSFDEDLTETVSGAEPTSNQQVTMTNGYKGQAAAFNATNPSYVLYDPPAGITGLQSFTISLWVNPTFVDADVDGEIDGVLGLWALSNPDQFWGNIELFVENGTTESAARVKMIINHTETVGTDIMAENVQNFFDAWTNHTITFDASTSMLRYYVNGSERVSKTTPWTGPISLVNNGPIVMGTAQFQTTPSLTNHGPEDWASHFTGSIDEVRVYSVALTADEINALTVLQGKGK